MKVSNSISSKVVLEFSSRKELQDYFFALNSAIVKSCLFRDNECTESFQKEVAQKDIDLLSDIQNALNPAVVYDKEI